MGTKTEALLEYNEIMSRTARCALSEEAAEHIRSGRPLTEAAAVAELKEQVSFVLDRIHSGDEEPQNSLPAIGFLLPKLEVEGAGLDLDEIYAIGIFIERGASVVKWLAGGKSEVKPKLTAGIPDCSAAAAEIFRVMDKEGKLRDLPEFRAIKRRIQSLTSELEAAVSRYTGDEERRRMLQSAVPSQRDGRTVLAVKANYRGRIKGIVHEVSSTGQTIFVEPEEVVEKNNDILIESRRLDAEILRVLRELTGRIAGEKESLKHFHAGIITVELIRARARYSRDIKGRFAISPAGSGESCALVLKRARHPLLGPSAVPIDFVMDESIRTVIITGPNTGGKTVALKTVGLLAMMNQSGLALPADEGTSLPVFDAFYADIGDEQSISQSLSTFSAHMTNIAGILASATDRSLALLDELGSGTDPEEGGAIAMAILDYLIEKKVRLITTTHHGILKNYGYTRQGVENASVEFDGRTLSPTYRIVMGVPGESRAVDIAARNGLAPDVVEKARSYIADERSDVSALIASLKEKHRELDEAAQKSRTEEGNLREERRLQDLKELKLRQKEAELKAGAAGKLRLLLSESRRTLENLVREVKEGDLNREKTLKVKEFLRNLEQTVEAEDAALEEEERNLAEERRRAEEGRSQTGGAGEICFAPGNEVLAGTYKRRGIIVRKDKKDASGPRWIVETGSLKMSFSEAELILLPPSKQAPKPLAAAVDLSAAPAAQMELSLRGMRLHEALEALQKQIDAAVLSGLKEFAVIHGKGDGILGRGVHEHLRNDPAVKDYYFSRPELGGFGRTEVILN
jgi:DNA mismatch repair protein MutS2